MKYSNEYKQMCVDLYRQGKYPETPKGIQTKSFRCMIRAWVRMEESCGSEALQAKKEKAEWDAEDKYELVKQVLEGMSIREASFSAGINSYLLCNWVKRYKIEGYSGLLPRRMGRPPKELHMKKDETADLTPSEREEMIRLRVENTRLQAEIAVIKKEIALREERCAAQLKARKQRSPKNSKKKDIP